MLYWNLDTWVKIFAVLDAVAVSQALFPQGPEEMPCFVSAAEGR